MIKKPLAQDFIFYSALVCIALSYTAHAAQIIVSDNNSLQNYSAFNALLDSSQNKKGDIAPPLQVLNRKKKLSHEANEENIPANVIDNISDILPADSDKAPPPINKFIQTNHQPKGDMGGEPYNSIKEVAKQILNKNSENELLQDSLIALSRAKQKIDEAEEIINELAGELITSTESEKLIFSNRVKFHQENTPNSISKIDESVVQVYNSQNGVNDNLTIRQQMLESYDYYENKSINMGILQKIFSINTLFYLFGMMLIIPIIMRLIRYLLFGKYQKLS